MLLDLNHRIPIRNILSTSLQPGAAQDILTPDAWIAKRQSILARVGTLLGESPDTLPTSGYHVYSRVDQEFYTHILIGYEVEPAEEVKAHLLLPPPEKRKQGAAVLCLHGTSPEAKDTQLGIGPSGRDYARQLALQGFITLAPDHACSGERVTPDHKPYDTAPFYKKHPEWSMVGKAIWDGQRALDILGSIPEVDNERIGVVGHSLGGHGSFFLAAFDERVKAAVCSCGLTTWQDNPKTQNWARDSWYVYLPRLRSVLNEKQELPFDLHELAALVAPRALLNISGMTDPTYGNNETMPEVGLQLHALYDMLGQPAGFANFLFGAGHDVPIYSQTLTAGWFEYWLAS